MSDIDLDDIRRLDGGLLLVFRELMQLGRTTEVARRLGLSQSAVSHALARLRDLFGDPLFLRRPHGLEPTQRALALAPRVTALLALAAETVGRERRFDPSTTTRRFNIGAPEFVTALIGADLVRTFRKEAPNASFAIETLEPERALAAVRRGEIDLAVGRFTSGPAGLVSEVLYEDRYCVAARKGHPKIKGRIGYDAWLKIGHVFAHSTAEDQAADHPPEQQEIASDIALIAAVPRWLTALVMAAASDAIVTCPRKLALSQARVLGLQVISAPFLKHRITVSVVRRADARDEGADWFLDQLRRAVR